MFLKLCVESFRQAFVTFDNLPSWFQKPRPTSKSQRELFPDDLDEVLTMLAVSADELRRWYERGWISFEPMHSDKLPYRQVNEVRFIRDVVRSGLTDVQIEYLFMRLPRPMDFDPAAVAYSFALGWVMGVPRKKPEEILDEHIAHLARSHDRARLEEIRSKVERWLEQIPRSEEDEHE